MYQIVLLFKIDTIGVWLLPVYINDVISLGLILWYICGTTC